MDTGLTHSEAEEIYKTGVELNKALLERTKDESIYDRQADRIEQMKDALENHQPKQFTDAALMLYIQVPIFTPYEIFDIIEDKDNPERGIEAAAVFLCGLLRK